MGGNNRVKHGWVKAGDKLFHYPDGRYQLRKYESRKKVFTNAGDNAADALAALQREGHVVVARKSAEAAGVKIVEEAGRVVLRKAAVRFEDDARNQGFEEAADLNRNITTEFLVATGLVYADEVTRDSVLKFHKYLRSKGNGNRTVANKHRRLMSFFKFLKMDRSDMPRTPKYDAGIPTAYSKDDNGKILAAADEYMKLVLGLGLKCGLRDQELMHLEWSDIHFEDSILRIASKPHWKFKVKDSEERDVPIPSDLVVSLKTRRLAYPKDVLVLPTANGKPNGKLLRMLKRLAKRAGLNCGVCTGCRGANNECQRWTLHKLRRSYATTLLRNGVDLATVQRYMGHADLESTMRYLSPATAKESQLAVNAISWT
jgi:integrase